MSRQLMVAVLGALALGGCATIPQPLQGTYTPVTLASARSSTAPGTHVRWGGKIVQTEPQNQQTCFFVLAEPLDSQARPERNGTSEGRFVACKGGFYDPEVFHKGKEITVTGTLDGTVQHKIGDYDYTYPKVNADNVYLWQPRPRYTNTYDQWGPWGGPGWGDPFWGGWGPWGGPWAYPRVIVVPRQPPPQPPKK